MRTSIVVCVVVGVCACFASGVVSARPKVSLSPKVQAVNLGERVAVTVRLEGAQTLRTYGVRIRYDTAVLKCVDVFASGFFRGYQTFFFRNIDSAKARAGADESVLGSGHAAGDGDLFTLVFTGRRYGTAKLEFASVILYDSSQTPIESETDDGTIVVNVEEILPAAIEEDVALEPCYPSPAGERVFLSVQSRTATAVTLSVYDVAGSLVEKVYDGVVEPGRREFPLALGSNGRGRYRNGVYYAVLRGEGVYTVRSFTVLR